MDLVHVDSADGHLGGVKLGHLTATEAGRNGCGPQQGRLEVRPLVQALVHTAGSGDTVNEAIYRSQCIGEYGRPRIHH